MPIASLPCIRTWHSNIRPVLFANGIWRPELERYTSLVQQIKEKTRERTALIRGKKELPFLRIICSRELAVRLAELTEELEELRTENALLLQKFEHVEDVLTLGDHVKVVCLGKDKMGRMSFSMKDVK